MHFHQYHQFKRDVEACKPAEEILVASKGADWWRILLMCPEYFELVANNARDALKATLRRAEVPSRKVWQEFLNERALALIWYDGPILSPIEATKSVQVETLALVRSEIAYQLVCSDLHARCDPKDPDLIQKLASDDLPDDVVGLLDKHTRMWLCLRRLSTSNGHSQRDKAGSLAIEDQIIRLVEEEPTIWAESLHILLAYSSEIGDAVEAITISLAQTSNEVVSALEFIADNSDDVSLRDYARGILLLIEGFDAASSEMIDRLLNQLARWSSSRVLFPHPLSRMSATWMSSNDAEMKLRSGLSLGLAEFRRDFTDQGTKNERALVQSLLTELSIPFRKDHAATRGLVRLAPRLEPEIALDHRTLVESEETIYGPDIAFIVRADLHRAMKLEIAEFVQVKKPNRTRERWTDSWKIDVKQLNNLLGTSSSSVYWLIDRNGTMLTVPAKYIKAWMPSKPGKSFTLTFNVVRSAAIPVDQFLAELLVGAWIGSGEPRAMSIARGEIPGLIPRNLVEVRVAMHSEAKG